MEDDGSASGPPGAEGEVPVRRRNRQSSRRSGTGPKKGSKKVVRTRLSVGQRVAREWDAGPSDRDSEDEGAAVHPGRRRTARKKSVRKKSVRKKAGARRTTGRKKTFRRKKKKRTAVARPAGRKKASVRKPTRKRAGSGRRTGPGAKKQSRRKSVARKGARKNRPKEGRRREAEAGPDAQGSPEEGDEEGGSIGRPPEDRASREEGVPAARASPAEATERLIRPGKRRWPGRARPTIRAGFPNHESADRPARLRYPARRRGPGGCGSAPDGNPRAVRAARRRLSGNAPHDAGPPGRRGGAGARSCSRTRKPPACVSPLPSRAG